MSEVNNVVGAGLSGVASLASVQFTSRILTFLLNVALTRYMQDPAALGVASVQLYLLYTVVLMLSRESVRRVCLRLSSSSELKTWQVMNLVWQGVGIGIALTPMFCIYFTTYLGEEARKGIPEKDYVKSIWLIGVAIILELFSEPMFVMAQGQMRYGSRSKYEALAVMCRCISTVLSAVLFDLHLEAFAWGYVFYSVTLLASYSRLFHSIFLSKNKKIEGTKSQVDGLWEVSSFQQLMPSNGFQVTSAELRTSAWAFYKQTMLKLVLAEGEKMVMVGFAMDPEDQAVYAMVFNLGSLVARFLFQPVEEVAFTIFGKLNDIIENDKDTTSSSSSSSSLRLSGLLCTLTKLMVLIGMLFTAFGPNYSHLLIHILYGERYSGSDVPSALGFYCAYVLVIAVNGITEAFVHAVADDPSLDRFNKWLVLCSVLFLLLSSMLLSLGAVGLILANTFNMFMRIAFSLNFILGWKGVRNDSIKSIRELIPGFYIWVIFAICFIVARVSLYLVYQNFSSLIKCASHVVVGVVLVAVFVLITYRTDAAFFKELKQLWKITRKQD